MDKDNRYWDIHKEIYNKLLNRIDKEIVDKIYKNPDCAEAHLLERRVEQETQEALEQELII